MEPRGDEKVVDDEEGGKKSGVGVVMVVVMVAECRSSRYRQAWRGSCSSSNSRSEARRPRQGGGRQADRQAGGRRHDSSKCGRAARPSIHSLTALAAPAHSSFGSSQALAPRPD